MEGERQRSFRVPIDRSYELEEEVSRDGKRVIRESQGTGRIDREDVSREIEPRRLDSTRVYRALERIL